MAQIDSAGSRFARLLQSRLFLPRRSRRAPAGLFVSDTLNLLRRFEPMRGLDWPDLAEVARHAREVAVPARRTLVQPPRRLKGVWYLAAGVLRDPGSGTLLRANSRAAREPIYPRCRRGQDWWQSVTPVRLLQVDEQCLVGLPGYVTAPETVPTGAELAERRFHAAGWLDRLAASPLLQVHYARHGSLGWQDWVAALQAKTVAPGEVLIRGGDPGDAFYVVAQGYARVRPVHAAAQEQCIRITAGGFFGEDALLGRQPRNASVSMPHGGQVLQGDASRLMQLVDDLWWSLARQSPVARHDTRFLQTPSVPDTLGLRDWLAALPDHGAYEVSADEASPLQDLLLLLLAHRGYSLRLRDPLVIEQTLA